MPGHSAASRFNTARSNLPSGACAMTAFGIPFSRIRAASARVSTPVMAMMLRVFSQSFKSCAAHAGNGEARALQILAISSDIAHMREGEGDDLPGIRRVGEDLLVARHRRVEANLASRRADRSGAFALDDGAVGKNEESGRRFVGPGRSFARAQRCGLCGQSFARVVHLLLLAAVAGARRFCKVGYADFGVRD